MRSVGGAQPGAERLFRLVAVLLGALCLIPVTARADSFDPISIGAHIGTLGAGVTLERPLLFDLSARVTTGTLSTTNQQTYNNAPWTSTFHENNVLVAMDWRPYGGRWRLSGGLLFGGDYVNKVAQSNSGNYLLNGNSYPVSGAGVVSGASRTRGRQSMPASAPAPASCAASRSRSTPASWCATARSQRWQPARSQPIPYFSPTSPPPPRNSEPASSNPSSESASSTALNFCDES